MVLKIIRGERSYRDILIYNVSYKNLIGAKPLRIIFDKVDRFIGDNDQKIKNL